MNSSTAVAVPHADIAQALHLELRNSAMYSPSANLSGHRSGVLGVAARLATTFADDPNFDHDHFIKIVLKGRES